MAIIIVKYEIIHIKNVMIYIHQKAEIGEIANDLLEMAKLIVKYEAIHIKNQRYLLLKPRNQ